MEKCKHEATMIIRSVIDPCYDVVVCRDCGKILGYAN